MFYYVDEAVLIEIKDVVSKERQLLSELKNEVSYLMNTDQNDDNYSLYNQVLNRINDELARADENVSAWNLLFDNHRNLVNQIYSNLNQIDISQHLFRFFE